MVELRALRRHWARHPPVHKMVAAFCGYKAPAEAEKSPSDPDDPSGVAELFKRHFPNGMPEG